MKLEKNKIFLFAFKMFLSMGLIINFWKGKKIINQSRNSNVKGKAIIRIGKGIE